MMDSYELLCYVCLKINCNLQNMCSDNNEMMKLKETFVLCVPEVDMQQLPTLFICDDCCDVIQSINRFRDLCLKNIKVFNKNPKSLKPHDKFYEEIHDNEPAVPVNLHECYSIVKSEPLSMEEDYKVSGTENIKNAGDLEEVEPLVKDNRKSTRSIRRKRKVVNYHETDSEKEDENKGVYNCQYCNATFAHLLFLQMHARTCTPTQEMPYLCTTCNKSFTSVSGLSRHRRLHTGEKPYKCFRCNKNFTRHDHLIKHIRTHTGERPYVCGVCRKGFSELSSLNKHKRVHTGERPFFCGNCKKAFTRRDYFNVHIRTKVCHKYS